jgi:hypothetical protein
MLKAKDSVYDFKSGQTLSFDQVPPNASTICSEPYAFHQTPLPLKLLSLLYMLVAWGTDDVQDFLKNQLLLKQEGDFQSDFKPNNAWTSKFRYTVSSYQHSMESQARFLKALSTFGGLYHPMLNRKQNPALASCWTK